MGNVENLDEDSITLFNDLIGKDVDEKVSFVYLHYLTKRNDSDFWRSFRQKTIVPDSLQALLPFIRRGDLKPHNLKIGDLPSYFRLHSYLQVCAGLEMFEADMQIKHLDHVKPDPASYKALIDQKLASSQRHDAFLRALGCELAQNDVSPLAAQT